MPLWSPFTGAGATEHHLPNSNQRQRCDISHPTAEPRLAGTSFDRRSVPEGVVESWFVLPDGHRLRRIDWPEDDGHRGSILFLPGRGDAYEKYLEALDQWHRAGWRVTAADWRGQGGSGRLGSDAVTGHIDDFADWIDDLAALWSAWRAQARGPCVLIGHSMGGHLALRALAEGRIDPDALVLSAPMLGFVGQFLPLPLMHGVAKLMTSLGDRRRPAWKWSEKPGETPAHRERLLTHDPERYRDELWWREQRPEIVMGPGSWGWVERAYASMRHLFRPGSLEAVNTPVLLLGTSNDRLVAYPAIVEAARRLPQGELVAFGTEAHHEILREVDPVRGRAMAAIAEFLDRVAPEQR